MNGANVLIKCLEERGVEYIFGYSGGAAMPIFDAIFDSKIELILTRHEQGATHMADGYARATGKPGVVLVTSGPGATNTITGIYTARMDSIPMIVLTGQQVTYMIGKDAFQEVDIFGMTIPCVKHSYLLKETSQIPKAIAEAFYITTSGRPGPVLLDIPKDVSSAEYVGEINTEIDLPGYSPNETINKDDEFNFQLNKIANLFYNAKKPLILVGHGAVISRAEKEVITLTEIFQAPVISTLLGKGVFPESHPLSLGMLGMHGTAYANKATIECDLIISLGSRWDDRISSDVEKFCTKAKKIHIDIDPIEINRIIVPDAYIIGDLKKVLQELLQILDKSFRPMTEDWVDKVNSWKKEYPLKYSIENGLTAQHVIDEVYHLSKDKEPIITTDVGQHQMWAAQYTKFNFPRKWLTSGGAGTMGFGFPAAIGAQIACPKDLVIAIVGDGGFQMTLCELSTAFNSKLPIKIIIIDNKYLGMVRQWQEIFFENRYSGVDLVGNPDFVKVANAYQVKSFRITSNEELAPILKEAFEYNEGPCLIHAEVIKEDNVFPMIPSGAGAEDMLIEKPTVPVEKPKGST